MANVLFKRGHHANLPATGTSAVIDGAFYLTDDTHRLYVGQGNDLVELNKSITTVASIDALPAVNTVEVGQFYYVEGAGNNSAANTHNGNILAVVVQDGATKKWVQVNPDTDGGYDTIKTFTIGNGVVDSTNNTITYTASLTRAHVNADNSETPLSALQPTFVINGSDLASITTDVEVDLTSTAAANDSVTVNTSGNGAKTNGTGVTLTGGTNVNITGGNGSAITISADDSTYELSSPAGTAGLTFVEKVNGSQTDSTSISFTAGTALSVSGSTASNIEYSHANVTRTDTTATAESMSGNTATFTVVDSVTSNDQGHVTAVATKDITVLDTTYTADAISANNSGDLSFTIKDNNNGTSSKTASGVLYHTLTVDGTAQTKYNQQDLGTFYSASKVDELIAGLNAMTYKGTVGTGGTVASLPSSGVKVGDTYMVKTAGTYASQDADAGDLFIASGTETDGVITSGLTWTLVPAGDDTDTQYTFTVSENATTHAATISAVPDPGNGSETVAVIVGGTDITAGVNGSTITLNHDTISGLPSTAQGSNSNTTPSYGQSFKIPQITVNDRGHVTALSETSITLPDSDDTTYEIGVDKTSGVVSIKLSEIGGNSSSTAIVVGDGTSIAVDKDNSNRLAISHSDLLSSGTAGTTYGTSASLTPAASGTIKVPNIKVNAQGHVTEISEQSITLPADEDTYFQLRPTTVGVATASGVTTATVTLNMSDTDSASSNASTSTIKLQSESLTLTQPTSTTDTVQAEIVWGTF